MLKRIKESDFVWWVLIFGGTVLIAGAVPFILAINKVKKLFKKKVKQ